MNGSESLLGALRRAGPDGDIIEPGRAPFPSLRNHSRYPARCTGRPMLLGHDGHPAGLSNGKRPELPVPESAAGPV